MSLKNSCDKRSVHNLETIKLKSPIFRKKVKKYYSSLFKLTKLISMEGERPGLINDDFFPFHSFGHRSLYYLNFSNCDSTLSINAQFLKQNIYTHRIRKKCFHRCMSVHTGVPQYLVSCPFLVGGYPSPS